MNSDLLTELLKCFSLLSLFLLVGVFLRSKVKIFQKLFLPASVIGGFVGLLISPEVLGKFTQYSISSEWIKVYSIIPGILIIPIFAAIPLGMFMNKTSRLISPPNVIKAFGIFMAVGMAQSAIGYATNMFFNKINPAMNLYRTFGYELSAGFSGGHGLAAATGKLLEGFGLPYWEIAQGVAMTTATVGLIGGMIFGIIFINIATKKGETLLTKNKNTDENIEKGFYKNIEDQKSIGREIFSSSSIETITFHLAIIFSVCGIAYIVLNFVKSTNIKGLNVLPVWTYSMIIMFVINIFLKKLNLSWMIDAKIKSKIIGTLSDFAIVSAIVSLPIKAIIYLIAPITTMAILGFIVSYIIVFPLTKILFKNDYTFERSIICWGTATGVLITGMVLLKICDPEYKTPALPEFSLGFSLMSINGLLVVPILNTILAVGSTLDNFIAAIVSVIIYTTIAFIAFFFQKRNEKIKN